MKLSKFANLVKNGGRCAVLHVAGSRIWLSTGTAIYRATELPDMEGSEQVRTVLDMTADAWKKVYLTEDWPESVSNVLGLNLAPYAQGEQDTEKLKVAAAPNGLWCSACRCKVDGELIFYNEAYLAPLAEEIKKSEYIYYTARQTEAGQRYLVVHDGMDVLAAIMPMNILKEEYINDLAEFQALCMEQFYLQGDALELLRTLPPESVHTCVTSPPYYNLRDYGVEGQIGNEGSVEEYLQALVAVFREVRRVLHPNGTLWVNVGDSYATKSGNQPPKNTRNSCGHTAKRVPQGYKKKDLIGIPWQLAFALRADGWYLRQDIIWQKPNCMPESVSDRCTKSHEYIFLLSKSERYYFDAAAISEPVTSAKGNARTFRGGGAYTGGRSHDNSAQVERESHGNSENKAGRRNKRSVWSVSTNGFRGAHFAVFPEKLIEPCILAGCPEGGVVLDPFAGSGTTGVVAKRMGRGFVGCEINPSYVAMAARRIAEVK